MPLKEFATLQLLTRYIHTIHGWVYHARNFVPTYPSSQFHSDWVTSCTIGILEAIQPIYPYLTIDSYTEITPEYVPLLRALRQLYTEVIHPPEYHDRQDRPSIAAPLPST